MVQRDASRADARRILGGGPLHSNDSRAYSDDVIRANPDDEMIRPPYEEIGLGAQQAHNLLPRAGLGGRWACSTTVLLLLWRQRVGYAGTAVVGCGQRGASEPTRPPPPRTPWGRLLLPLAGGGPRACLAAQRRRTALTSQCSS